MTSSLHQGGPRWPNYLTWFFGGATLVLGLTGLYVHNPSHNLDTCSDLFFSAVALLFLQQPGDPPDNTFFALARFAAVFFVGVAAVNIIRHFSSATRVWLKQWWIRVWSLFPGSKGHTVVFGLGPIGMQLVKDIRSSHEGKRPVVVVEKDETNSRIEEARRLGVLVLVGDAANQAFWEKALLHRAHELFITCGDDAVNIEIASRIIRALEPTDTSDAHGKKRDEFPKGLEGLTCYVHTGDPAYTTLCRTHTLIPTQVGKAHFHIFNVCEHAARRDLLLDEEQGLIYQSAPAPDEVAHYFLFGFGAMGQATALQLAHQAHFRNHRRLRLSIIDHFGSPDQPGTMYQEKKAFLDRYPAFCPADGTLDLAQHALDPDADKDGWHYRVYRPAHPEWRFDSPQAQQEAAVEYTVNAEFLDLSTDAGIPALLPSLCQRVDSALNPSVKAAVLCCFDDDRRNVRAALDLQHALLHKAPTGLDFPLYLYLPDEEGLAHLIRTKQSQGRFPLFVFGQRLRNGGYHDVVRPEIRELAKAFYKVWASVGAVSYKASSSLHKTSSEAAAAHAQIKLQAIGKRYEMSIDEHDQPVFKLYGLHSKHPETLDMTKEEEDALARMEHNRWLAERLLAGWRYEGYSKGFYGLDPAAEAKRENEQEKMSARLRRGSILPWETLHAIEKEKDFDQVNKLMEMLKNKR